MSEAAEVIIRPETGSWAAMVRSRGTLSAAARRFREEMGLPVDRAVVMAGHQAQVWHPGILAKLLAARAAARAGSVLDRAAATAWLVVDQDDHDPWAVRYPVRRTDGGMEVRTWRMGGNGAGANGQEHVPTANRAAVRVDVPRLAAGEAFAARGVGEGLARIAGAMNGRAGEGSAARQVGMGTMDLLGDGAAEYVVFATTMARTELFGAVVERMRREPRAMVEAYNAAVRAHRGVGIAELRCPGDSGIGCAQSGTSGGTCELPLWHVPGGAGALRRRVTAGMLGKLPMEELSPRALLMTGILRWAGCDLFIHGTGGAGGDGASGYDTITEEWMRTWLGVSIAPMAMVTATVRLRIESAGERITPEEIARAQWLAHAARHRPGLLGDREGEAARERAVATLKQMRWKRDAASKRVKLEVYRALQGTLERARTQHGAEIARLEAAASAAAARREEAEIVADRTWAFPLYERGQLEELAGEIGGRFGRAEGTGH